MVGRVVARAMHHHAVDQHHSTDRHRERHGLLGDRCRPGVLTDLAIDSWEMVRSWNQPGTSVFDRRFLKVEDNREDRTRPLTHISVKAVIGLRRCSKRGVVVSIFDQVDVWTEYADQWADDLVAGDRFKKDRIPIDEVRDPYDVPRLISYNGFDLVLDVLPYRLLELVDALRRKDSELEVAGVTEVLDLFEGECWFHLFSHLVPGPFPILSAPER